MNFRRRILVLPLAAAAVAGVCAYKLSRDYSSQAVVLLPAERRPAPRFELYDEHEPQRVVRLESYLGRHAILVVFYDGAAGADRDPVLSRLRKEHRQIESKGMKVLAVSTALPQENRKVIERSGEFPFALLSDPSLDVHRQWGRVDAAGKPVAGVFLIDRAGQVAWKGDRPLPLDDPQRMIDQILHVK